MSELPPLRHISSINASYREAGDGFPIVMVPGLGLSSRFYELSYATFARAGFRFLVPDLPGTGDTPGPVTGISAEDVTGFLATFAHGLGLPPALYVGHSLGTQSVLLLAVRAPALVAGVALVGVTGGDEKWKLIRQVGGLAAESIRVPPSVIAAVAREYIHVSPLRYIGTWIRHREPIVDERLTRIDCPALLLMGERDSVMNREYVTLLREQLSDLTEMDLADGSHALPRSQHTEFEAAVLGFARRICG